MVREYAEQQLISAQNNDSSQQHIAEIRFNILYEQVDFFVIAESTVNHQGKPKKLNFDIKKFKKFEKKIIKKNLKNLLKKLLKHF